LKFLILESKPGETSNRAFALRNFGALPRDGRFAHAFDLHEHRWMDIGVNTPEALLRSFRDISVVAPRDLSRYGAEPAYVLPAGNAASAFRLIVGDSPDDVALAWNSCMTSSGDCGRSSLWLSEADTSNVTLLGTVAEWISENFWPRQSGRNGVVLSRSLPQATLERIAATIRGGIRFVAHAVGPDEPGLEQFTRPSRPVDGFRVQHVPLRDDAGFVRVESPLPVDTDGALMVDLHVEDFRTASSNSLAPWHVPRRSAVAGCFGDAVRISSIRRPSFEVAPTEEEVRFRVPSVRAVLDCCLVPSEVDGSGDVTSVHPRQFTLETSEAGLQLRGVLGLFGGLLQAGSTFEDAFWRDFLTELAGRPEDARSRQIGAVREALAEFFTDSGSPRSEKTLEDISERVAEKAWRRDPASRRFPISKLPGRFGLFVARWCKEHPSQTSFRPGEKYSERAKEQLAELVEKGVLLQGVSLRCAACFTEFWLHVDDLRRRSRCPGCLESVDLPPDPSWSVMLNELVAGALRDRGVLPVIHALADLQRDAHSKSFAFAVSQDVLACSSRQRVTDLDLLALIDGELVAGEVKSHPRGFDAGSVDGIVEVARTLMPDVVIFAAEGDGGGWPHDVELLFDKATRDLDAIGVRVRRELLQWP
jgi:hypothetical protein